jgi:HrpA-like RNA helicase
MKKQNNPEIMVCGLGMVILYLKSLGIGKPIDLIQMALSIPDTNNFTNGVNYLKEVN